MFFVYVIFLFDRKKLSGGGAQGSHFFQNKAVLVNFSGFLFQMLSGKLVVSTPALDKHLPK